MAPCYMTGRNSTMLLTPRAYNPGRMRSSWGDWKVVYHDVIHQPAVNWRYRFGRRGGASGAGLACMARDRRLDAVAVPGSDVVADLDQVLVRVAEVDAEDAAGGAGALDRTVLDGDTVRGEFPDHPLQRVGSDQAQVGAAGRRMEGLRLELVTGRCRLILLWPKARAVHPAPNVTACMPSTWA